MQQKVEIEVDVPDGWRAVAYRAIRAGDYYLSSPFGVVLQCAGDRSDSWLILEKIEPKRESRWLNIHSADAIGHPRSNRGLCDFHEHPGGRAGLIRLDYEDGKLVAVTLEPEGEEA